MRIVEFSTRRPVTVFIFALAAVVFGVVAFDDLAVDLLPDISYPSLTVRTELEGAAPIEVESLITKPIEDAVGVVNNVVKVSSSSRADRSEVTLEFSWGTNMDFAALDVRERLDVVRLPVDADKPVLLRYDPSLDPILRIGLYGDSDLVRLRLVAEEEVKRSLERIEGVAAVLVSGGLEEEIQVEVDERRLASLGLSIDQVITRLAQENINLTGGRLREGQTEYLVRTINEFVRPEDMRSVVLDRSRGAIVRLGDVARVYKGSKEREIITRIAGQETVEVAVFKEGGTNTVAVADAVLAGLDAVREKLAKIDPGLRLERITDQAGYIRQSVRQVLETAVIGGTLAILVLYLFLRSLRTTGIIGLAIPISVIATFFLMYAAGISLNIMSLGGITLGIGLLVDNSIVVLEAIQRRRDQGADEIEAARAGAGEVGQAVVASTLSTVCVFVPIVFVEGIAGQLFGDQALTVTFSLVVSLFVALTVIPMLASRRFDFAAAADEAAEAPLEGRLAPLWRGLSAGAFWAVLGPVRAIRWILRIVGGAVAALVRPVLTGFDAGLRGLTAVYARVLGAVLRAPVVLVAVTLALFGTSLLLLPRLGTELIPELVQGEFFVDTELPPGTQLRVTSARMAGVERFTRGLEGVDVVYAVIGTSNEQGGVSGELRENIAQMTVRLAPPISRQSEDAVMEQVRSRLDAEDEALRRSAEFAAGGRDWSAGEGAAPPVRAAGLEYRFGRPSYFSFRTPIEVEIRGYNLRLLERLAAQTVERLAGIAGLVDVKSSTEGGNPEIQIRFQRDRLASLGLGVNQVAEAIRAKVQGEIATDITREDRTIDIRLRVEERYRDSVRNLRNLNIHRGSTTAIPLSAVADVVETTGPAEIRRADGSRVALITANLVGRDLGAVSRDITAALGNLELPLGFDWELGGQRQEMETSFDSMRLAILLAVFMVYLVMASQFESLLHPLVILFSVPFSLIGVLVTLYAFDVRISVVVMIGVILLAGIVVNNAIILVDYTNRLRRGGMAKIEALKQAGQVRLRPILMTTSTTVLGLLPMAIGLGEGSELRTPMALTVIGGLITSTLLTLLIIPAVYSVLDRRA
ncbi:MAG TPA: efflux RND transporter permease subunit [Thermoanaerobaculia bacterium]|nr:efflux RND transporter permease subunit [Thermoanaerobaculia bacterium]